MPTEDLQLKPGEDLNAYYLRTQGQTQSQALAQTAPSTISSDTLAPQPDLSKQVTYPSVSAPIVPVTDPFVVTPEQKPTSDLTKRLEKLYEQTTGESAFRAEQEAAQGVPEATKTLNDLLGQQQVVLNEQAQIQLTKPGSGQGALPTAIIERQYAEKLRENAVSALGINSLVAAAEGKLATAQNFADRAVAAKFDPIKAQIDVAVKNLDLIIKSPEYTNAEKRQAQAQLDAQNKKLRDINKEIAEETAIRTVALEAAKNGADTRTLQRVAGAKTQVEALQILAEKGLLLSTPASAQEYNFAFAHGYTGTYNDYQNEDANRKALVARAAVNGLPYQVTTQIDKLSSGFDSSPIVKNYNEVQNKKLSVDSIINSGIKGPGDLAIVYEFMKALDSTSVVRETEYATAAKSGNIFAGAYARFNGYLKEGGGFLPEQVKKDFQSIINQKLDVATKQYTNLRNETARKINIKTGASDGGEYLTDYAGALNQVVGEPSLDDLPPLDGQEKIGDNAGFFSGLLNLYK